jgi:hypothetical protein
MMLGDRWLSFARAWLDEGTIERTLEPLVADWRHENASTRGWRAATVNLRGQLAILQSMAACLLSQLGRPLPAGSGARAWLLIETFAAVGTGGLMMLFSPGPGTAVEFVALLPATLCVSLPLAIVPMLILTSARRDMPQRARRWLALRTAVVVTVVLLALAGWITPGFNQQWREQHAPADVPRPILRGDRELTLSQLSAPGASLMVNERHRRREVHNRIAVILSPITLSVLGLAIARRARRPLLSAIVWWLVTPAAWSLVLGGASSQMRQMPIAHLAPWVPHLVLLLASAATSASACRRASPDRRTAPPTP